MLLVSPDRKQRKVEVAGATFTRTLLGYFEIPNETLFTAPLLEAGWTEFLPTSKDGAVIVPDDIKCAELAAVVIRCTCHEGQGLVNHPGAPCPNGRAENLGIIAAYYRNPFKRFFKRVQRLFSKGA